METTVILSNPSNQHYIKETLERHQEKTKEVEALIKLIWFNLLQIPMQVVDLKYFAKIGNKEEEHIKKTEKVEVNGILI